MFWNPFVNNWFYPGGIIWSLPSHRSFLSVWRMTVTLNLFHAMFMGLTLFAFFSADTAHSQAVCSRKNIWIYVRLNLFSAWYNRMVLMFTFRFSTFEILELLLVLVELDILAFLMEDVTKVGFYILIFFLIFSLIEL